MRANSASHSRIPKLDLNFLSTKKKQENEEKNTKVSGNNNLNKKNSVNIFLFFRIYN